MKFQTNNFVQTIKKKLQEYDRDEKERMESGKLF